jgi:hypothetical protein
MRSTKAILLGAVLGLSAVVAACNLLDDADKYQARGVAGGSSSSSTTGSSGSTGSTGSSTSSSGCTDASQCPGVPAGPCASLGAATCTNGVCGVAYTHGPAPSQVYGNCHQNVCDATGKMTSIADDQNVYLNANDCLVNECADGGAVTTSQVAGSMCMLPVGMGVCELDTMGLFGCVQCGGAAGCPGATMTCSQNTCVMATCTVCGTPGCLLCPVGQACTAATQCASGVCTGIPAKTCQASCSDGVKNGNETGVDCGGGTCPPCPTGENCALPTDCASGVCAPSVTMPMPMRPLLCQAPTCTDGVPNGTETGIDCGGMGDVDGGAPCPPCGM